MNAIEKLTLLDSRIVPTIFLTAFSKKSKGLTIFLAGENTVIVCFEGSYPGTSAYLSFCIQTDIVKFIVI